MEKRLFLAEQKIMEAEKHKSGGHDRISFIDIKTMSPGAFSGKHREHWKEFSRKFSDNFKKNFGRPIEWGLVKRFPWSIPQLEKLEHPVDPDGNPWPLDDEGKPILKE